MEKEKKDFFIFDYLCLFRLFIFLSLIFLGKYNDFKNYLILLFIVTPLFVLLSLFFIERKKNSVNSSKYITLTIFFVVIEFLAISSVYNEFFKIYIYKFYGIFIFVILEALISQIIFNYKNTK